jgi:PAS domain S-box-containing protein
VTDPAAESADRRSSSGGHPERALRESEQRYRALFAAVDQGFCIIEKVEVGRGQPSDYRYIEINPAFRRHTGLGDVVGKTIRDVVPGHEQSIFDIYDEVVRTGRRRHFEQYVDALDLWVDAEVLPSAGPGQIAVLFTDVTQRKRAEMALRESEEMLRSVLENSRDGINMLDLRTGRYVFMNEAQVALTGFTAEEISGISAEEAWERVHPEDRHVSTEQQRRVAAGEDMERAVEYRWKVKSGEYRWFSDRRRIVRDERGEPVALVGVSRDITERKRVEGARSQQQLVVGGIATILQAAMTAPSEERLGEVCLQVAELLTESRFGFIGELGADGLLHEVALSDSGRRECAMQDKSGHRRTLAASEPHGLYGHVVLTGQPLMTDSPADHPESIGLPPGHPPLSSFLGVPLGDGSVTGVLAVADREGGYRDEDRESLMALAPVIREAFDRRRAEQGLRENDLRSVAQQERDRLARDLHDSVTQALFAATIKAEALTLDGELPAQTAAAVEEVRRLTRGALAQMRALLLELRGDPLDDVSLVQLMRHLVEATESRTSTGVRLTIRGGASEPPSLHAPIYRIAQEALNNVVRHARAAHAWVVLDLDEDKVRLEVGDDGAGFEPGAVDAGHLGLRSMRERAAESGGELRLVTTAGEGTRLLVEWSVEPGAQSAERA